MPTQTQTPTAPALDKAAQEKIAELRALFADASQVGKTALENVLKELTSQASDPPPIESAGRSGLVSAKSPVDDRCTVSAWRRQAASHVPAITGRQPYTRRDQGRHSP